MAKQRTKEELIEILIPAIIKNSGEPVEVVRARLRAIDTTELFYMETKQKNAGLLSEAAIEHRQALIAAIIDLDSAAESDTLAVQSTEELEANLVRLWKTKMAQMEEDAAVAIGLERIDRFAEELQWSQKEKTRREEEYKKKLVRFEQVDRETFARAARRYEFSEVEANWNVLRGVLDPGFTSDQVGEVLRSGGVQLAEPTPAELETWERERIADHNQRLLALDPIELRKQARLENVARTVQFEQEQDRREVEGTERRDATLGFPELPLTNSRGESLNSQFFMRADSGTLRQYIKKYGPAQVTRALRERI